MFKWDFTKLCQIVCAVNSLPHHLPGMVLPLVPVGSVSGCSDVPGSAVGGTGQEQAA